MIQVQHNHGALGVTWRRRAFESWKMDTFFSVNRGAACVRPHPTPRSSPVDARAVAPGLPQAAGGVQLVPDGDVGQEGVDAVEGVGPVQVPPPAR